MRKPVIRTETLLWSLAGLLFVAVAGVAVYKVWPLLNPVVTRSAVPDPDCDLRAGPCSLSLPGGGRISLGIEPRSIPVIQPLQLEVRVEGIDASRVEVDFQGIDMSMGFNRARLLPGGDGRFNGTGTIPVCIRNAMEWEARVLAETEEGLVSAPFRFITVKPGVNVPGQ
ncbi:MAG: hypothetical protein GY703_10855 [Gammaproteobacteria bacterium]|nr:hypothetical protein [Gammaproteobacteria bacterium]